MNKRKPGRPSKYTPATIKRLLDAIEDGLTHKSACIHAGLGEKTFHTWRNEHPDLEERIKEAEERARAKLRLPASLLWLLTAEISQRLSQGRSSPSWL